MLENEIFIGNTIISTSIDADNYATIVRINQGSNVVTILYDDSLYNRSIGIDKKFDISLQYMDINSLKRNYKAIPIPYELENDTI